MGDTRTFGLGGFTYLIILLWILPFFCTGNPVKFTEKDAKCIFNNTTYSAGEKFQPEPCMFCKCPRRGGRVQCGIQDCQFTANCVVFKKEPNECCGTCLQQGCKHADGRVYHPGAVISASQCERCVCPDNGGPVQCRKIPCPELSCVDSVHDEGHCCPRCPNGPNCWLNGKVINAGDIVLEEKCKICHCYEGLLPGWLPASAEPKAVCFVLTSKESEGCPDEAMVADQASETSAESAVKSYVLHNNHEQRNVLYQKFLKQHQRRKLN